MEFNKNRVVTFNNPKDYREETGRSTQEQCLYYSNPYLFYRKYKGICQGRYSQSKKYI